MELFDCKMYEIQYFQFAQVCLMITTSRPAFTNICFLNAYLCFIQFCTIQNILFFIGFMASMMNVNGDTTLNCGKLSQIVSIAFPLVCSFFFFFFESFFIFWISPKFWVCIFLRPFSIKVLIILFSLYTPFYFFVYKGIQKYLCMPLYDFSNKPW